MDLIKARVTNYRCVDDSGWFNLDRVTCFVGKNESGKTAILKAIERLRPLDKTRSKFEKLTEYPRQFLSDYAERHPSEEATVIQSVWRCNDESVAAVEAIIGKGNLLSNEVAISKRYSEDTLYFNVQLNDEAIIKAFATQGGCTPEEVAKLVASKNGIALGKVVDSDASPSAGIATLKDKLSKFRNHSYTSAVIDELSNRMPSFLYFSNYDRMSGKVSIEDLSARSANGTLSEGQTLFLEFLSFAGITLDDVKDAKKSEELRAQCEAASNKISSQIFEYWSQNRYLEVDFTVAGGKPEDVPPFNTGTTMEARVKNQLHKMTVPFDERSAGFVWFFSFLVHFSQVKKQQGNVVILLDEPGLALHAKAQTDLLRYFDEKLKPKHQLLYSTHSPFMVPTESLLSVRTVEDVTVEEKASAKSLGTKVGDEVLSTDRDTLFPLQAALGYEISQSLFVGAHSLMVEGPSDLLYFSAFSRFLKAENRTSLDARWTICPTGGVDKVMPFVSLFGGNKLDLAVVIDYAAGQKTKVENLKRSELLKSGRVLTFADFVGHAEADVEDMLGPDLYASILNALYALKAKHKISADQLGKANAARVLVKATELFAVMPPEIPEFNHYAPAAYLLEHFEEFKATAGFDEAAERFERLFTALNGML